MLNYKLFATIVLLTTTLLHAESLIFGVVPQQSPQKLISNWTPLINYLSEQTGKEFILKIEKSIPEFEKKLYAGKYDIAYMNPYHYVLANKKQKYQAFVRADKKIVGILVANKEIKLNKASLEGKTFLFPAPFAFAATLLPKYELKKRYQIDIEKDAHILYVNSHDSVYKGIARGIGDIGGGIVRTYNLLNDTTAKEKLNIIYKTDPYPSHPIALHHKITKKDAKSIVTAILNTPKELLQTINMKKLIHTNDTEYDSIRELSKSLEEK